MCFTSVYVQSCPDSHPPIFIHALVRTVVLRWCIELILMQLHRLGMNGKVLYSNSIQFMFLLLLPIQSSNTTFILFSLYTRVFIFSGTEILPLLVTVLERPFQKIERAVWLAIQEKANVPGSLERAVATAVTRDQKLAVQKVTKVLAMYSLVPEAKQPMCDQPGMLRWLTRIVDTHNFNRVKPGAPPIGGMASGGSLDGEGLDAKQAKRLEMATRATSGSGLYMTEAARFNTIATLTNLAAHEANRMPMLREPGLLDNICRAIHNERSDVPKQCAALAIMVRVVKYVLYWVSHTISC